MKKIDYYGEFLERLDEFLGVKLQLKARGNYVEFIPEFNSKFIKKTLEHIGEIFVIIDIILEEYYEDNNNVYFTDLIEEFSQKLIGHMVKEKLTVTNEQMNFMDVIKGICNETYEGENSNLNILLFKNRKVIPEELKKMGLDFLPFDTPKKIEEIFKEKLSLKMLNGDNLVLIIGSDFRGYGLGINEEKHTVFKERLLVKLRKQNNGYLISFISLLSKNILNYIDKDSIDAELKAGFRLSEDKIKKLAEYSNEKMLSSKVFFNSYNGEKREFFPYIYMEIKDKELKLYLQNSIDNYLSYRAGKWKLKSFHILKFLIIEKFYMDSFVFHLFNDKIEKKDIIKNIIMNVDVLVGLIKNLLEEGKGGLFIILERTVKNKEMEKIFVDGNEDDSIYRRTVLKDGNITRIKNHNFEYLKLISKVDGAVTLDSEFNLLSFGRLVKLDMNGSKEKVEGARTAAAISGSKYGLAIKVSEDKKITLWEDGIKVLEI
ncbi:MULTISPECIES: diadenylate cyclase [Psychrilyobacter]|uniref:DAC domain-containing protein n=1 Tax=Psychrilyobacter piezotolerans TaxID=2293438 RepID=A0ABX9KH40_9FUSO|nr:MULTISPECIES: diadenylate cyclase [Psychrilyobacter]MCS5420713.1 diadenylate cyclase [Psychrilyobacter sp. S5]NDI78011.1 hypothetical protein [Psychrilyobacter piezotolerans]RDE61951.1 hypothetical protein DV867_08135 [Psychrilyobacter sp. S5]REI41177.1 hypothetical protein DYH56_08135 [Psychrilyobacter piezotolerans]